MRYNRKYDIGYAYKIYFKYIIFADGIVEKLFYPEFQNVMYYGNMLI